MKNETRAKKKKKKKKRQQQQQQQQQKKKKKKTERKFTKKMEINTNSTLGQGLQEKEKIEKENDFHLSSGKTTVLY